MRPQARRLRPLLFLFGGGLLGATAGPDADGMVLTDSDEADGPPVATFDLSGVASLGLADDGTTTVTLPFTAEWYGDDYTAVTVSNEGVLFFDGAVTGSTGTCPGDGTGTWSGVAALWDDWSADAVRVATFGRYPERTWVAEWSGAHGSVGGDGLVQVWLMEGHSDVVVVLDDITFGSTSVDGGASAVVGVQGGSTTGVEWSCGGGLDDEMTGWFGPFTERPGAVLRGTSDLETPWSGVSSGQLVGRSLAAGDVDADGLADLAIGNPDEDTVYLVGGSTGSWGTTLDQAVASLTGTSGSDLGAAVLLHDLDGDGYDDLLAGAPEDDTAGNGYGLVAAVSGDAVSGGALTVSSDADFLLTGPTTPFGSLTTSATWASPRSGVALDAGDVDGDGYADLLVGADEDDTEDTNAGALYVVLGSVSTLSGASWSLDDAVAVVPGTLAGDHMGATVHVCDIDEDGFDDVIIGAPYAEPSAGTSNAGRAFALLGGALSGVVDVATDAAFSIDGSSTDSAAGTALATGDVDGDGVLDLIVGAPYAGSSPVGAVAVFSDVGVLSGTIDLRTGADVVWDGVTSGDFLGGAVASGDVDGDGVEDVLAGAAGADAGSETGVGVVGVFLGPVSASGDLEDADHRIAGEEVGAAVGSAVVALGDSNGDGQDEVAFSGPFASSGTLSSAGLVWRLAVVEDFLDSDGDGFVDSDAGGNDCDDTLSTVNPATSEIGSNLDDDDCDGWIDDAVILRFDSDSFDFDVDDVLGADTDLDADHFDFEDATSGDDLSLHYFTSGVRMFGPLEVGASAVVYGAAAADGLAARVVGDGSDNDLALYFEDDVDAVSFALMDPGGAYTISAYSDGAALIDGELFSLDAPERAGGSFVGLTFASAIDTLVIAAEVSDGFGVDDLAVVWTGGTDRDGDGYSNDDGDCDDGDAAVSPGATEDLTNGIDDDCDGAVDGGSTNTYTDTATWANDADITPETVDFEDLTTGDAVSVDYVDLGILFDGTLDVSTDVDGAAPVDVQAGEATGSSITLVFEEVQPGVAFVALDVAGDLTITGSVGGTALYSDTVSAAGDNVDEGVFVGLVYDYGVDELTITSDTTSDTWGIDEVIWSELGLDDADGDGYTEADGDCDDDDASTSPDATEIWYDGVDSDCSGTSDYDVDGDGHDSSAWGGLDCDDGDSATSPSATETWYDGIDSDCSGTSDYDIDGDGYDSSAYGGSDCDDTESTTSPGATETWYDGVDSDCAGDDDYDADGDGYSGSGGGSGGGGGFGGTVVDCDDGDASVSPGATETWYDGVDSDCSGDGDFDVDGDGFDATAYGGEDCNDDDAAVNPDATSDTCYDGVDTDCDGWSDYDCDRDGFDMDLEGGLDCDDDDATINPLASDTPGDGIDSDCDGAPEFDDDGDGYDGVEDGGEDCDDEDASVSPGATEIWYDGFDQDCDGWSDDDADLDGYDASAQGGLDCDDSDGDTHPGATDFAYDGIDSDCDGSDDFDLDGDGYTSDWYSGTDCDDEDAGVYPGATEVWYDGVDTDCSGGSDYDADGDGVDSDVYGGRDCDDTTAAVGPAIEEIVGDGVDQDCDGLDDVDRDGDGWLSLDECDDRAPATYPGAPDACYDGVDADCAEDDDYDCDRDGHTLAGAGGDDCDDGDPLVSPSATEVWYDGVDQDCDGASEYDADGDGHEHVAWGGADCDDLDAAIHPDVAADDCGNGDEDCDGRIDEDCEPAGDGGGSAGGTDDSGDDGAGDGSGGDSGEGSGGDSGEDGGDGSGGDGGGSSGSSGDGSDGGGSSGDGSDGGGSSGDGAGDGGTEDEAWEDPNADWVAPASPGFDPGVVDKGCGCSQRGLGGGLGWGLLLGVVAVGRRRR